MENGRDFYDAFHPPESPTPSPPFPHVEGPRGTEATKRYPRGGFPRRLILESARADCSNGFENCELPLDTGAIISTCKNTIEAGRENI